MHSAPPIVETLQQRGCQRPLLLARVLVARTSARVEEEEEEESIGRVLVEWSKWCFDDLKTSAAVAAEKGLQYASKVALLISRTDRTYFTTIIRVTKLCRPTFADKGASFMMMLMIRNMSSASTFRASRQHLSFRMHTLRGIDGSSITDIAIRWRKVHA
ncbi:hypothetical protein Pmar_PMAR012701 [Perkinsus marinus ATCC 50983]|uniref:Uncharacterized protein n=1 Tax=Perkinsus marinus (strain ATCC 50983 / TXsc) TaxID=423536 RepID=C5K828_PERM5|nr:hypothetical protein Pmar_PMAR012701 [Perkinsus marinus ATCC 50983]EER19713.1 hypothetical protein Pmar_PMAR012701 [Perkinsus marinus ATCC 50983]|eukprot:XP_002787917.1 hypothetical protein Pmar_PMAR012701 [Perkinsus marinus ATCC 50983]